MLLIPHGKREGRGRRAGEIAMEEKSGKEVEPRIGVYVCHCGGNISDYVDVATVAKELGQEPNVSSPRT